MQNAPATAAWAGRIQAGGLAGSRGHAFTPEDRLRARGIEMLMCDFALDLPALARDFGEAAVAGLRPDLLGAAQRFAGFVSLDEEALRILPEGRALTRMIASHLDAHAPEGVRYSQAS